MSPSVLRRKRPPRGDTRTWASATLPQAAAALCWPQLELRIFSPSAGKQRAPGWGERVGPSSEAAAPTPPPLPCHHRVRDRQQQDLSGADGRDCLTWGLLAPVNYTRGCFGCLDQDGEKARHSLEWGGGQEEGLAKGLRQPPYDF